ncbi:MAG: fumarylacetoacetate hydrolase family protein [Pirellulaceae bacterium]|jgi:2-keto-4-pentenoate hydratase/2-oxohepta-3-ene-1,7-dioic acid hydratase in catechol pathway|nr:fumarylacetoacetate hydrolase family protein [Pirellulaceae bacterium]
MLQTATRNSILGAICVCALAVAHTSRAAELFVRFQAGGLVAYGAVEGDRVRQLSGDLFGSWTKTDKTYSLREIKILTPTTPTQVLALAGNYKSHIKDSDVPEKFRIPQPFFKSPSCLVADGENIVIPKNSPGPVHFEAELVIVIGKTARKVSKENALDHVFGVTCGNDVSERFWQNDEQNKDVQWWRAKGTDTFGPVGPYIARGLKYDDLLLRMRQNGQIKQEERTRLLIHDVASTVSFISQHVTLHPGDLIFTGTPGTTAAIQPGDVLEVELEGVGVLRNPVVAEK